MKNCRIKMEWKFIYLLVLRLVLLPMTLCFSLFMALGYTDGIIVERVYWLFLIVALGFVGEMFIEVKEK